jgi:hypothetical protein
VFREAEACNARRRRLTEGDAGSQSVLHKSRLPGVDGSFARVALLRDAVKVGAANLAGLLGALLYGAGIVE